MNDAHFPLELVHNGGSPFLRTAQKRPICLFIGQKTEWINLFCEAPNMFKLIEEIISMAENTPLLCHIPNELLYRLKDAIDSVKG